MHGLRQGVYYQFFVSANGEKGEGNTSTIVGHRIPTFGANHQAENGNQTKQCGYYMADILTTITH